MSMIIMFDEPKREQNLQRHGFDLADAERLHWNDAIVSPTHSGSRGGRRFKAIGLLDDVLVVAVVFALLGTEALSVISLRPASRKERKQYEER